MQAFNKNIKIDYGCINKFTIEFKNYSEALVSTDFYSVIRDNKTKSVCGTFDIAAFNVNDHDNDVHYITFTLNEEASKIDIAETYYWDMKHKGIKIYTGNAFMEGTASIEDEV